MEEGLKVVTCDEFDAAEDDSILPGFRFHPTDEELVGFYLRRKAEEKPLSIDIISQIDIYKYEPWDLPRLSKVGPADKEWYFFCLRGRKYRNSIRPNRVTGCGFWKATGIDKPIYSSSSKGVGRCVGLKKSLVYYRGSAGKGTKTDWMMHEFRLPPAGKAGGESLSIDASLQEAEVWTICRIFKRNAPRRRAQEKSFISLDISPTSSSSSPFHTRTPNTYASPVSCDDIPSPIMPDLYEECKDWSWPHPLMNSSSSCSNSMFLNANDIIRDCNWEEIGKMVEIMTDPLSAIGYHVDTGY